MNNNNNELPPAREAIVDKLHGALSAFRRERDDLHRKKQLAEERLRLMREEQGAMETSVNAMTAKLHKLQESGNAEALQELQTMEQDVMKLQKEVQFQHAELVSKSSKVHGLRQDLEEQEKRHTTIVTTMKNGERRRRTLMMHGNNSNSTAADAAAAAASTLSLQQELESGHHYDMDIFLTKLPRWMQQSALTLEDHAAQLHLENERVSKLLIGHQQRHLRNSAGAASMQQ
mmetsp:Transcript_25753/g.42874  ORF Transcript_25753/g.42874 Transcript_25753/m.42874 type:complete len:231 (+) Transcript_25753:145-837(+)|eukprot:CAMPEP_0119017990 /NCGR_PEP_ID=MMETSP1176-20130426/18266_1 /TAXON_ID=265551 /ORGANISM="Synedropsis recta cf, Strain CCMP1620" /LENGTH=230 /DNA_ID=CAMNT_0006971871 /DNA_START=100 /DNA_END=795 /DNA_ORIENTATION=+